ncbi:conserved Plasmodium protein, unknown function [Plasmodium ovale curtisi]|uniref:Uncharacterized protein n=1 Tax=Plasmodium ovale curtisi TaxID=864141 RepID=A0A1A8X7L0_PLAOA|nr:conserved Plasmodium protein, unknown function [Plasmodium ovale curtisi]
MDVFTTEKILDQMKDYNLISLNTSGVNSTSGIDEIPYPTPTIVSCQECDEEDRLLKIRKEITPREAAEECNRIPACKFIVFNYNKKLGYEETTVDKSILCSKPPTNRIHKLGFFLAGRNNAEVSHLMKKKKDRKNKITNSTVTAVGGSITPDGIPPLVFVSTFLHFSIVFANSFFIFVQLDMQVTTTIIRRGKWSTCMGKTGRKRVPEAGVHPCTILHPYLKFHFPWNLQVIHEDFLFSLDRNLLLHASALFRQEVNPPSDHDIVP